jgi:selenocysteine lyase/cysteine desulfurase
MFGKRELLLEAEGQNHFFIGERELPYKLQPGNVNHELCAALPGILEYFDAVASAHGVKGASPHERLLGLAPEIASHEAELADRVLAFLRDRPGVRIVGETRADADRRVPTIAFTVDGRHAEEVATALEAHQVAGRWGHFYAARAIEAMGLADRGGVVRASLVHYNTHAEVERLLAALDAVL